MADNQADKRDLPERADQKRSKGKQDAQENEPDKDGSGTPANPDEKKPERGSWVAPPGTIIVGIGSPPIGRGGAPGIDVPDIGKDGEPGIVFQPIRYYDPNKGPRGNGKSIVREDEE